MKGKRIVIEIGNEISVDDLRRQLQKRYPPLNDLRSFLIAVNTGVAEPGQMIYPGDEVAVIPPVSGG